MEFIELFDDWAADYDQSVAGNDEEYKGVFDSYHKILQLIAFRSHGNIMEFGVGTGNLTMRLVDQGHDVTGIEPSVKMREIAKQKLPEVKIVDGNFLEFPDVSVDTFVSSYAFHHLTDDKKELAIKMYGEKLGTGGKIIFGDTIFKDKQAQEQAYIDAKDIGYNRLANDLNTEYYTTIPILDTILKRYHFTTHYEQMNDFVWIIEAKKGEKLNYDQH